MSVEYDAHGTLAITPPVPLAALWELLEAPSAPLVLKPAGTTEKDVSWQDGEWFAVAATDSGVDSQGRPELIGAVIVKNSNRSFVNVHRLDQLAKCCAPGTDFDGEVLLDGEGGPNDTGEIAQATDGLFELYWD